MQRFLSFFLALCLSFTVSLEAYAKRFGGGSDSGAAPIHQAQPRQVQPMSSPPTAAPGMTPHNTAMPPAAKPSGMSRWLGPLAGIAAGGLLASLFFGDGFQGFQFFDFLLIILLVIGGVFALRAFRRKQAASDTPPAYAGAHAYQAPQPPQPTTASVLPPVNPPANAGGLFANFNPQPAQTPNNARIIDAPAWFDESRFVSQGREHFMNLQQHWDMGEMQKIAEFVTPELLQQLKQERAALGDGFQSTLIEYLQVHLDGVSQQDGKTIATLTFEGVSKTSRFDQGEVFSESWRMERRNGDNQPWLLAGIRQNY